MKFWQIYIQIAKYVRMYIIITYKPILATEMIQDHTTH
jgi:hypothetical protein